MIELALPYKCRHRDAGIQKVFPNAAFDLPNGRKWAPNGMFLSANSRLNWFKIQLGGCVPNGMIQFRYSINFSRFNFNSLTQQRPMTVVPMMRVAS